MRQEETHRWASYDKSKRSAHLIIDDEELIFKDLDLQKFDDIRELVLKSEGVSQEELVERVRNLK